MNLYRVTAGPLRIGQGQLVSLDAAQFARRRHRVTIVEADGARTIVSAREVLDIKTGEIIGLGELPKALLDRVEPVAGPGGAEAPVRPAKAKPRAA